jgi:hypothetical protein
MDATHTFLLATCFGVGLIAAPALADQAKTDKHARPKTEAAQASAAKTVTPNWGAAGQSRSEIGTGAAGTNPFDAGGLAVPDTSASANSGWQSQVSGLDSDANTGWQSQLPAGSGIEDPNSQADNLSRATGGNIGGTSKGGIGAGASGQGYAGAHFNNGGTVGVMNGADGGSSGKKKIGTFDDGSSENFADEVVDGIDAAATAVGNAAKAAKDTVVGIAEDFATGITGGDDTSGGGADGGSGDITADTGPKGDTGPNATGQTVNNGNGAGGGDAGGGQGGDSAGTYSGGANAQGHTFNGGNVAGGDAPLHKPKEQGQLKSSAFNNGVTDPVESGGTHR